MTILIRLLVLGAALLFIVVSAGMNAAFLSSLGRTPLEAGMLGAVSVASDAAKVALPVVLMRALALRVWVHAGAAALMLIAVIGLSLASGTGFAASTRSRVVSEREMHTGRIAARQRELAELEQRGKTLVPARPEAVIEAELTGKRVDRQWQVTTGCTSPTTAAARLYCSDVFRLRTELETAKARTALGIERHKLTSALEVLQRSTAGGESDPQALVLAGLFGLEPGLARVVLTSWTAVILELGSVIMVLLAAGPAIRGWCEPGMSEPAPLVPAELPVQADRQYWRRQRSGMGFGAMSDRVEDHVGGS
jgi:hypothetical protein